VKCSRAVVTALGCGRGGEGFARVLAPRGAAREVSHVVKRTFRELPPVKACPPPHTHTHTLHPIAIDRSLKGAIGGEGRHTRGQEQRAEAFSSVPHPSPARPSQPVSFYRPSACTVSIVVVSRSPVTTYLPRTHKSTVFI
jgi:hypothetical protein